MLQMLQQNYARLALEEVCASTCTKQSPLSILPAQVLLFADVKSKMNLFYILTGQQGDPNFFQTMSLEEGNQSNINLSDHIQVAGDEGIINEDNESSEHPANDDPDSLEIEDSCENQDDSLDRLKEKLDSLTKSLLDRSKNNPTCSTHRKIC